MPISPSPTQVGLSVANAAELSTVSVTQFSAGEIAYKRDDKTYWSLDLSVGASGGFPTASGQGRWVPFTAASGAPQSTLVFQPGGVSGGNVITTWTELKAYILANAEPQIIWDLTLAPSNAFTIPESIDHGYGLWTSTPQALNGEFTIIIPDGVTIKRPPIFDGSLQVYLTPATTPSFDFSFAVPPVYPSGLTVRGGALLINEGSIPAYTFTGPDTLFVGCYGASSSILNSGAPIINIPAGIHGVVVATQTVAGSTAGSGFGNNWISGDVDASLYYLYCDASFVAPTITPGFTGFAIAEASIDVAQSVVYLPANLDLWAPPSPQTVAAALDRIATVVSELWGNPIP